MILVLTKILLVTTLAICLSSCRDDYPIIQDQEQLSIFIPEAIDIEGKKYLEVEKIGCFAKTYRISKEFIGAIDRPISIDYKECNKMIGYAPQEYSEFASWLVNFRNWLLAL